MTLTVQNKGKFITENIITENTGIYRKKRKKKKRKKNKAKHKHKQILYLARTIEGSLSTNYLNGGH